LKGIEIETPAKKTGHYCNRFFFMVFGTACLFTFSFMLTVGGIDRHFGKTYKNPYFLAVYLLVTLLFLVGLPLLKKTEVRKAINITLIVVVLLWSGCLLYMANQVVTDKYYFDVIAVVGLAMHAALLFQWNLHFALNKVENAGRIIWVSTLISVALVLLFLNNSFILPLPLVCALPLIAAVCCWWIEISYSSNPASEHSVESIEAYDKTFFDANQESSRTRILFFSVRIELSVLYGVAAGSFSTVVGHPQSNELVALIVAVLALVCLLIPKLIYRQKPMPNGLVVALPVFLVIGIIAVYLGSDVRTLSRIAVGVAWLVGHVFFFSQLPTYREMTKMNLVKFAYIEKITILVPYTATAIITQYIFDAFDIYDSFANQVDLAIVYYMLMMVVIYCIALLRHLLLYFPKQQRPLPSPEPLEEAEVLRAICTRYALTKRESEVLAYLAKGYSRLYIEKKLYISKGTAKTHIFHIFQKLQVTSQDELIELVEQV